MTTTLIADDESDMLLLLRLVLRVADVEVVAEASDGVEAVNYFIDLSGPLAPDLVVLDNRMPSMTGIETARQILAKRPEQPIVLYSAHLDDTVRSEAAAAGIRACLHKQDIDKLPNLIGDLFAA